jgi:TrmH family RNA methyltransferase
MTSITSPQNPRLKELRRLSRRRERERSGRFVAEGEDLVLAAERGGRPALAGFRLAGSGLGDRHFHDVEPDLMRAVSTLGSGTRVIAIYEQRWVAPRGPLCIYLHGVGDPGNVGTIVRSAHAFGASCVALGPGCADPHSPKAVRASMGAIFDVALARVRAVEELPGERIALSASARETLRGGSRGPITLLVGAERDGLPPELLAACERRVRIPIASDSLNAAMAATVALYEATRDRARAAGEPAIGASRQSPARASSRVRTS